MYSARSGVHFISTELHDRLTQLVLGVRFSRSDGFHDQPYCRSLTTLCTTSESASPHYGRRIGNSNSVSPQRRASIAESTSAYGNEKESDSM